MQQNISLDLENKLNQKDTECEKISNQYDRAQTKADAYLQILDEIASKDRCGLGPVLQKLKHGLNGSIKEMRKEREQLQVLQSKSSDEDKSQLLQMKQKNDGYERVMKEMKKQMVAYKNEIQGIKKMEQYLTLENY